jgi:hypothetical protein
MPWPTTVRAESKSSTAASCAKQWVRELRDVGTLFAPPHVRYLHSCRGRVGDANPEKSTADGEKFTQETAKEARVVLSLSLSFLYEVFGKRWVRLCFCFMCGWLLYKSCNLKPPRNCFKSGSNQPAHDMHKHVGRTCTCTCTHAHVHVHVHVHVQVHVHVTCRLLACQSGWLACYLAGLPCLWLE